MKTRFLATVSLCVAASLLVFGQARTASSRFTFVSWGDTKGGLDILASQSGQVSAMNPDLTIYCGDLVSAFSRGALDRWRQSLDTGSGGRLSGRTFLVRGNHDLGDAAGWREFFDARAVAGAVAAGNYRPLDEAMTYSFDFANAHFIAVDVPGDTTALTMRQIDWMDEDLASAERRGLTHAFIFWHGPIYPVGGHCCSASKPEFVAMADKHRIVSATFHGHEHQMAWVHIDDKRYPAVSHPFEEFVTGSSGADTKACKPGRSDYCAEAAGFAAVEVSGSAFTVSFFLNGAASPAWSRHFTKATSAP